MTAMQSPRRMASAASPMQEVPVEQAVTTQMLWPIAPVSMAIIPEVESTRRVGDEGRADAIGPLLDQHDQLLVHQLLAAGPRAEDDADLGPVRVGDLEAGVGDGLLRGGDAHVHLAGAAPDGLGVEPLRGSKSLTSPAALPSYGGRRSG